MFCFFCLVPFFSQQFFSPNPAVSVTQEQINAFLTEFPEIETKASFYNLSKPVFQTILIVQSNAGYSIADRRFNYGRVIPNGRLKDFPAFADTRNGVVACNQRSSGLEAVALSLHFLRSNEKKALPDAKWLTLVFGPGGDLSSLAKEADVIYEKLTKKSFQDLGLGFGVMSQPKPTDEIAATLSKNEHSAIEEPKTAPLVSEPSHSHETNIAPIKSVIDLPNIAKPENAPVIEEHKQNIPIAIQVAKMPDDDSGNYSTKTISSSEHNAESAEDAQPVYNIVETTEKETNTDKKEEGSDISGTYNFYRFENCNHQIGADELFNSKTGHNSKNVTIAGSNMLAEQLNTPYEITKVNENYALKHTNILKVTKIETGTKNITKVEGAGEIKLQDNKYVLSEKRVYTNSVADLKHLNMLVTYEITPLPNNKISLRLISTEPPTPMTQDPDCSIIMVKQ
ncbi:MAG: hypothetical protein IPM82_01855 [Saprospiraceae bacterium]|nr:hypothetical protein [Saprospiraceae bacterium]